MAKRNLKQEHKRRKNHKKLVDRSMHREQSQNGIVKQALKHVRKEQ